MEKYVPVDNFTEQKVVNRLKIQPYMAAIVVNFICSSLLLEY